MWPPDGTGPALPDDMRWLPANAARDLRIGGLSLGEKSLPASAAGAMACAFRNRDGGLLAVSLEALTGEGVRISSTGGKSWRKTFGLKKANTFRPVARPGSQLLLVGYQTDWCDFAR